MRNRPTGPSRQGSPDPDPESIAIQALTIISRDPDLAARFLASSGLAPAQLRRAAADPAFLLGVLDYVVGDEPLLLLVAEEAGIPPEAVVRAHARSGRR